MSEAIPKKKADMMGLSPHKVLLRMRIFAYKRGRAELPVQESSFNGKIVFMLFRCRRKKSISVVISILHKNFNE